MIAEVLDAAILLWLITTWFYEGHHRRCTVIQVCKKCGESTDLHCSLGETDGCKRNG